MGVVKRYGGPRYIRYVESHLRLPDARERAALSHLRNLPSLLDSIRTARFSGLLWPTNGHGHPNGPPLLAYGCQDDGVAAFGVCWMLGTDEITKHPLGIIKFARGEIARWLEHYSVIYNFVDLRNELHVRWLEMMGFSFGIILPVNGVDFQFFYKERS